MELILIFFIVTGIAYGKGAKTIKNDKDLFNKTGEALKDVGSLIILIFFASQLVSIFRQTNLSTIITAWGANIISNLSFTGIPLVILILVDVYMMI